MFCLNKFMSLFIIVSFLFYKSILILLLLYTIRNITNLLTLPLHFDRGKYNIGLSIILYRIEYRFLCAFILFLSFIIKLTAINIYIYIYIYILYILVVSTWAQSNPSKDPRSLRKL